uniref:Cadherin 15 n=1 Tax=Chinchilla lanigera TaxID=34839 RepID=A0A8C2UJ50_CHILA
MDAALLLALGLLAQSLDLSWGDPGRPGILHPWRRLPAPGRVRRAWVIPPISVPENYKGLPYMLVQIRSDKRQPGGVIYSIQGPGVDEEPLGLFSVEKFSGRVFLNAELDREKTASYRLKVFALDLGGSVLEEPTDLEIVVVDQNDNRPAFVREVFAGRVLEGAAPGTYVTRAEATDADDPDTDNAALHYSILEQGSPELFSIHARTGEIRTVHVGLDREAVAVYNLTLQVADMSGEGLTATASAIISVDDINDNAPEFTRDEFSMEATEAVSGVDVGRLEVEDRDLPGSPNWVANFTILEGDPSGHFGIRTDPRTNEGVLSVVKPLDYESHAHYELRVSVQNEAPLQAAPTRIQRGQARLSIRVQDINEPPVFPENPLRTSLAEGAAPGTFVATFSAQDPDVEQLQRVSYSKDYDPEDWLQVDGATGRVQTQRALSPASPFLKDGWYRAVVLALDDVLVLLVLLRARFRPRSRDRSLLRGPLDDDLRDNILNYNEQGGGEEDQDAYDLNQLRHPSELAAPSFPPGRPPLRREAPLGRGRPQAPRPPPASPADIASFIRDGLQAADSDPSVPPYDTALIYDYEGDGSAAGTLSSPVSSLGDEDQDYDYLQDWGPRFARLADLYGHP